MATCRLCNHYNRPEPNEAGDDVLIKYGVRHYAHAGCALEAWGAQFFQRLTPWQCEQLPVLPAAQRGLELELLERICTGTEVPAWASRALERERQRRRLQQEAR